MSVPAEQHTPPEVSLDDLAERVVDMALKRSIGVTEAAMRLLDTATLPPHIYSELTKLGLATVAQRHLNETRTFSIIIDDGTLARTVKRGGRFRPPVAIYADSPLWQVCYTAVDGQLKRLAQFTIEDFDALLDKTRAQIAGLKKVVAKMKRARDLMATHGASVLYELPEEAFRSLEGDE